MFKRIIYPTDFTETSLKSFSLALDIATVNEAEIIVLYTYRLITESLEESNKSKIMFKRDLEAAANRKFEELKSFYPDIENIDHTFLSEVGFVKERLSSAVKTFNTDLVVLCENIQKKLLEWDLNDEKSLSVFHCPVMLVPSPMELVKH